MESEIRFLHPTGRYGFLSNYFEYVFRIDRRDWRTVEHYYQAQKFDSAAMKERIRLCGTPDGAKGCAHSHNHLWRSDWDEVRCAVMRRAVLAKFTSSGFLSRELLDTGDAMLIEDSKSDAFWGIGGDDTGSNMLGVILMETRARLNACV